MSGQLTIRRAEISDLKRIYEIEVKCFHEDAFSPSYMARLIKDPRFTCLVAILGDKIVGFIVAAMETFGNCCVGHIYSIDVDPEYRRRGIGSRLLEAIEDLLKRAGAKACYLEARKDNVAAINLYQKHKYVPVETLKDYYGIGSDGIRFAKILENNRGQ